MEPVASIIKSSGLTHQQIAERARLSVSLIQKLASGRRTDVRISTYEAILGAIGRPVPTSQEGATEQQAAA